MPLTRVTGKKTNPIRARSAVRFLAQPPQISTTHGIIVEKLSRRGNRMRPTAWILCALAAPSLFAQAGPAAAQALTQQYCVGCHSAKAKTAGIVLEGVDWSHPGGDSATLEKVLRKVETGEMPPPKLPHPTAAAASAL